MSKKIKITLIVISLFTALLCANVSGEENETASEKPDITAGAAILMDVETGRIMYKRNIHERRYVASTTKIMTAVIALEKGRLNDVVTVSKRAASTGGSSLWLEEGEKKTLEELLFGLMLRSGNDAAVAIAEHIGKSVDKFSLMMTDKAHEIGAENTVFKNPHGLHHEGHYSTAYDLALITAYAMKNSTFRRIIGAPRAIISWPEHEWDRVLHNQNRLLNMYEGADGVKTGWTTPAGRCFVGSATRDEWQLIAVVLNAPDMWEDTQLLLDYGFTAYKKETLLNTGRELKTVDVEKGRKEHIMAVAAEEFYYPLTADELSSVKFIFHTEEPYRAPLKKDEKIGMLEIQLHGKTIGSVELVAGEDVRRASIFQPLIDLWENIIS